MNIRFSNSPCRTCEHYHSFWEVVGNCVHYPPFELANCECTYRDYVPSDNLEYLEYMYDKKGEDKYNV